MPDKVKTVEDLFLKAVATNKVITTVRIPNPKAKTLTNTDDSPNTIAIAAPTPAPDDTPSKSGDTNLF